VDAWAEMAIPMGVQLEPADVTEWEKMKLIGWLVKHMPVGHVYDRKSHHV